MRGISASGWELKDRLLWRTISVCLFLLILLSLTTAVAADQHKPGYKGPISKEQLIEKLKTVQGKKDEEGFPKLVQGYVIDGNDIIDIIRTTDLDIQIRNAVIKNGLDFRKLKKTSIDQLIATEQNPGQKKHLEKLKQNGVKEMAQVRSSIAIIDSEIHTYKENGREYSTIANKTIFAGPVTFDSATFSGDVHFGSLSFGSVTFSGYADFRSATFNGEVYFGSVAFGGYADFRSATFSSYAGFDSAMFSGVAYFDIATFGSYAGFGAATFSSYAGFAFATFNGNVNFASATFNDYAGFASATFSGVAYLPSATFSSETYFGSATFSSETYFGSATFSSDADFGSATFSGDADFRSATFSSDADFGSVTFSSDADFGSATFSRDADFREVEFDGTVTYFVSTTFNRIRLSRSQIKAYADFRESRICKLDLNSSVTPTLFRERVDFRNAMIESAHIQDVIFANDADFSGARFERWDAEEVVCKADKDANSEDTGTNSTMFRFVTFEKEARFNRTAFTGSLAFENSIFKGGVSFIDASMKDLKTLSLSYLSFKDIKLDWDALPEPVGANFSPWIGDQADRVKTFSDIDQEKRAKLGSKNSQTAEYKLEPLSKVFGQLEGAFDAQKKLADKNEASYFRQLAELRETEQREGFWPVVLSELEWFFWGLPTGYGTKIWRLLGVSATIWLLFTLIFSRMAKLDRKVHPDTERDFTFKLRLLDLPKQFYSPNGAVEERSPGMTQWINAMRFSWIVLFKIGYRDTTAIGSIMGIDLKYIIWFEWLLGYAVIAAIVVTLANTMPLANALITGVF